MSVSKVKPEKITRPIQLLAVWLLGLVALVSAFLTAAVKITSLPWLQVVLIITAGIVAIVIIVLIFLMQTKYRPEMLGDKRYMQLRQSERKVVVSKEYKNRLEEQEVRIRNMVPEDDIMAADSFGPARFEIVNRNLSKSTADILVSSDDNHLSARGGVAKSLLDAAGESVAKELEQRRIYKMRQGNIAISSGGELQCRAIVHPAVIDLDENRYPDQNIIRIVVRSVIHCAIALGGSSIAFPVLGGGTASKSLTSGESIQVMIEEIVKTLCGQLKNKIAQLTYIGIFVFERDKIKEIKLSKIIGDVRRTEECSENDH